MSGATQEIKQYIQNLESQINEMKTQAKLFESKIENRVNVLKEQLEIQATQYESALNELKIMILEKESILDPPNVHVMFVLYLYLKL